MTSALDPKGFSASSLVSRCQHFCSCEGQVLALALEGVGNLLVNSFIHSFIYLLNHPSIQHSLGTCTMPSPEQGTGAPGLCEIAPPLWGAQDPGEEMG